MSAPPKKTVMHQQLYGSNRCLKQQARPVAATATRCPGLDHYGGTTSTTTTSLNPRSHCMMQHSQSINALPTLDAYGSCSTLQGAAATCSRHGTGMATPSRWYVNQAENCCCVYNNRRVMESCTCGTAGPVYQQQQQRPRGYPSPMPPAAAPPPPNLHRHSKAYGNGYYFGYDHATHLTDEEDSAFPGLPDRDLHLLHHNVPALRRTGVDTMGIRQYFYPDGGWGWIICGLAFLAHILTTGLQLSYCIVMYYANIHFNSSRGTEWLGALSWSISMLVSPFVVALCRKKLTRLIAVVGGLILPLGMLFTSFATELEQTFFSYGFVFGIGVAMVRESSTIMLGTYFKRRRKFVEMVAMSGEGVGIALFSVIIKEGVGKAGWRVGLQIIAGIVSITFFMALFYRPASLYHPQRRAIQHLKNQRKKMRENKLTASPTMRRSNKYFLLDISSLKSATVKILIMAAGVAALGIYTPMFTMCLKSEGSDLDIQDFVLLQPFLGMSMVIGILLAGALLRQPFQVGRFRVSTQIVSQVFVSIIAVSILFLSFVMGYQGLCALSWIYGIGFGGFRYALKILALERIKLKQFSKAWGLIRGVESIPVLISVPLTIFLNDYSLKYGRAGYYICSAAAAIGGIIIFFIRHTGTQQFSDGIEEILSPYERHQQLQQQQYPFIYQPAHPNQQHHHHHQHRHENGFIATLRAPPTPSLTYCQRHRQQYPVAAHTQYHQQDSGCEYPAPDLLLNRSCISLNQVDTLAEQRANTAYCCRLRLQCFRHMPSFDDPTQDPQALQPPPLLHQQQPFDRHNRRRRTIESSDIRRLNTQASQPQPQYHFGQGSVGSRMGKRLQKSLSFIQNPYCCDGQWSCNCHGGHNASNAYYCSHGHESSNLGQTPLLCTCDPQNYMQNCRSRSVPEGLSSISTQCLCRPNNAKEIIYLPRQQLAQQQQQHQHQPTEASLLDRTSSIRHSHRLQATDSMNKPMHYVEQITTSV